MYWVQGGWCFQLKDPLEENSKFVSCSWGYSKNVKTMSVCRQIYRHWNDPDDY